MNDRPGYREGMRSRRLASLVVLLVLAAASMALACRGTVPVPTSTASPPARLDLTPTPPTTHVVVTPQPQAPAPFVVPPAASGPTQSPTPTPIPTPTATPIPAPQPTLVVAGRTIRLELARTRDQHTIGLSGREHLDQDAGMLFIFPDERVRTFWMRDTLIPLDLVYLDTSGVVVSVHTMQPEPGTPVSLLRRYPSAGPARYALEVNAGLASELEIKISDVIDLTNLAGPVAEPTEDLSRVGA